MLKYNFRVDFAFVGTDINFQLTMIYNCLPEEDGETREVDKSCERNAEIVADVEGCLVEPDQEEKIESHHAESSVLHNLYSGTGGKPGGEER